jgi:hypothetical protein
MPPPNRDTGEIILAKFTYRREGGGPISTPNKSKLKNLKDFVHPMVFNNSINNANIAMLSKKTGLNEIELIGNLFSDTYYDIINQYYILHLQFLFNELGIRYLFCDAFDTMINKNIDGLVDKTHLIDSDRYWGYQNKTMVDLLIDTNRKDVWEDNTNWINTIAGKHPNSNGYKLIADELYKFINDGNLLTHSKPKKSYLI